MRVPRGSASSVLSLSAGAFVAIALSAAWLPINGAVEARGERQQRALHLTLLGLAADALAQSPALHPAHPGPELDAAMAELRARLGVEDLALLADHAVLSYEVGTDAAALGPPSCDGSRPAWTCADVPGTGLQLAIAAHEPANASEDRRRTIALLVALGAVVSLLVIVGIRWLLSPIERVASGARRIAAGERGVRVDPHAIEEIDQLAHAVNRLAEAVEHREDEINGRIEVVTQLTSMVAHEVRNPLQSIALLAGFARTEADPALRAEVIGQIEAEINVLEGVVKKFLRSSGPVQIVRSPTDMVVVLNQAVRIAEPPAQQRRVSLFVQAPGRLHAEVDGSLIRRAIENLLLNAIEYAGQEPPGQVAVTLDARGGRLRLIVEDDGPGVPSELQSRIFEPYFSNSPGGTGLGLALCRQVMVAHGGGIQVERSPLGGARFTASLPLQPAPPAGEPRG